MQTNTVPSGDALSEPTIHPAVKKVIGKRPLGVQPCNHAEIPESTAETSQEEGDSPATQEELKSSTGIKVPRYVPPKLPEVIAAVPVRGEHRCSRKKLHIGNVSKWIPVSERTDNSSHRWMVITVLKIIQIISYQTKVKLLYHSTKALCWQ